MDCGKHSCYKDQSGCGYYNGTGDEVTKVISMLLMLISSYLKCLLIFPLCYIEDNKAFVE